MSKSSKIKIIPVENSRDFMGFVCEDDLVKIYAPATLRFSEDEKLKRKEIQNFLQSFSLAKTLIYKNSNFFIESKNNHLWDIDSYIWIIHDFIKNGYYFVNKKKCFFDNKGKINWKKTMKYYPIISNGNFIYNRTVANKNFMSENIITDIYKYCLNVALERIGWLFNYNFKIPITCRLNHKEMINHVLNFQKQTFVDLEILKLNKMKRILLDSSETSFEGKKITFGINHFYYVFEKMVDKMFGNIYNKQDYNPLSKWHILGDVVTNPPLEPDTLYHNRLHNIIYILDSKMYQYGYSKTNSNLPGSASIQKQITYGNYIYNKFNFISVRNSFIIPYNKYNNKFNLKDNIVFFGYATADWGNLVKQDYEYIIGICIDFNYLISNYKTYNETKCKELLNLIDACLEDIKQKVTSDKMLPIGQIK